MLLVLVVLMAIFPVNAYIIYSGECFTDGHAEITLAAELDDDELYTKDIQMFADGKELTGTWDDTYLKDSDDGEKKYEVFTTEEGLLEEAKIYRFKADYVLENNTKGSMSKDFSCPGLLFSCALMHVDVLNCGMDGNTFVADVEVFGLEQGTQVFTPEQLLTARISAENPYPSKGLVSKNGGFPEGTTFTIIKKSLVRIAAPMKDNQVESFFVSAENTPVPCSRIKYKNVKFDDVMECSEKVSSNEDALPITPTTNTTSPPVQPQIKTPPTNIPQTNNSTIPDVEPESRARTWIFWGWIVVLGIIVILILVVMIIRKRNAQTP